MWGPDTREALIAFQRKEGFSATGSIDTRTVGALGLSGKVKAQEFKLDTRLELHDDHGASPVAKHDGTKPAEPAYDWSERGQRAKAVRQAEQRTEVAIYDRSGQRQQQARIERQLDEWRLVVLNAGSKRLFILDVGYVGPEHDA